MRWFFEKMCDVLIALRGGVLFSLILMVSLCMCGLFFVLYFISRLIPGKPARAFFEKKFILLYRIVWGGVRLFFSLHCDFEFVGSEETKRLNRNSNYIMISNHQSWLDVFFIAGYLQPRLSPIKFYMKRDLLWQLPFASWYCYLNGFPFLRRKSNSRDTDAQSIKDACSTLRASPGTLVIFLEGTRFSVMKQERLKSRYQHLLNPKSYGLANSLYFLQNSLDCIIDCTVVYKEKKNSIVDFILGRVKRVEIHAKLIPLGEELVGDYQNDPDFKQGFKRWLQQLWQEKEDMLSQ